MVSKPALLLLASCSSWSSLTLKEEKMSTCTSQASWIICSVFGVCTWVTPGCIFKQSAHERELCEATRGEQQKFYSFVVRGNPKTLIARTSLLGFSPYFHYRLFTTNHGRVKSHKCDKGSLTVAARAKLMPILIINAEWIGFLRQFFTCWESHGSHIIIQLSNTHVNAVMTLTLWTQTCHKLCCRQTH